MALLLALSASPGLAQYPRPSYPTPGGVSSPPPAASSSMPGSGGQVMYFCKPADAAIPVSGSGQGTGVVPAADTNPPAQTSPLGVGPTPADLIPRPSPIAPWGNSADPRASTQPLIPGLPQTSVPYNQPGKAATQPPAPMGSAQPSPKSVDPQLPSTEQVTTLPPRSQIFGKLRDEGELEKWVMEKVQVSQNLKPGDPTLKFPPQERIGGGVPYQAKTSQYPPHGVNIEPTYLVHRRLLFEEVNAERYGWDLGILQPLVSSAYFYKDVLFLPSNLASGFAQGFWDTNAGKCLPGAPVPYMLYPPGLTITGGAAEGVVATGLAFILH